MRDMMDITPSEGDEAGVSRLGETDTRPPVREHVHSGVYSSSDPTDSTPSKVSQIPYRHLPQW